MNMIKTTAIAALMAGSASVGAMAATTTLDFTGETIGAIAGDTFMVSQDGLDFTFTGPGLQFRTLPAAFEIEYSLDVWLSTTSDAGPITMSIGGGATINSVTYLNPINGNVTSEVDEIEVEAFDATATLIDSADNSDEFNTLFGNIASLTFVEGNPSAGFVLGQFVINYDASPIPLPAGLPLLLAGLGGFGLLRRLK